MTVTNGIVKNNRPNFLVKQREKIVLLLGSVELIGKILRVITIVYSCKKVAVVVLLFLLYIDYLYLYDG